MIKIFCEDKPKYVKLLKTGKTVFNVLGQKQKLVAELNFVSMQEIKELNRENRNIDRFTDVLSFPTLENIKGKIIYKKDYPLDYDAFFKGVFIGSIVICEEVAFKQAKEYGHSRERECTFLVVHSLLHLLGYDHETEQDRLEMRALEDKIMQELNLEVKRWSAEQLPLLVGQMQEKVH